MKLKLIDYEQNVKEVRTGTCELCFGTMVCSNPTFIFQKENGEAMKVNGYYWDWGDYTSVERIDNIIDFAEYIYNIDFKEEEDLFSFSWLDNLIYKYNSERGNRND